MECECGAEESWEGVFEGEESVVDAWEEVSFVVVRSFFFLTLVGGAGGEDHGWIVSCRTS